MQRVLESITLAGLGLVLFAGCKGCGRQTSSAPEAPKRELQAEQARLRERLAARNLDRTKTYPTDADGKVTCGKDADCFIVQGERCAQAIAAHEDKLSAYGLVQRISTRYTIVGADGDKCLMLRDTLALSAEIEPGWVKLLKSQGKTDEEVEQIKAAALESLREGNPERFECSLTKEQMLEATLNLAESHYDPQFWRLGCNAVDPPGAKP